MSESNSDKLKKSVSSTKKETSTGAGGKQLFTKTVGYGLGSLSSKGVGIIKKAAGKERCQKIGEGLSAFKTDVKKGWKTPDSLQNTTVGQSSPGLVLGSFSKYTTEWLNKTYKASASGLGKACKKGRVKVLTFMWNAENPNATKTEKEQAVRQIKALYKNS